MKLQPEVKRKLLLFITALLGILGALELYKTIFVGIANIVLVIILAFFIGMIYDDLNEYDENNEKN